MAKTKKAADARPFKTNTRPVTVTKTYLVLDGKEFEFYDLYETVEAIGDTSYGFNHVLIHNDPLEAALIKRKVFEKTVRGSGVRGSGYDAFWARLEKTYAALQEERRKPRPAAPAG